MDFPCSRTFGFGHQTKTRTEEKHYRKVSRARDPLLVNHHQHRAVWISSRPSPRTQLLEQGRLHRRQRRRHVSVISDDGEQGKLQLSTRSVHWPPVPLSTRSCISRRRRAVEEPVRQRKPVRWRSPCGGRSLSGGGARAAEERGRHARLTASPWTRGRGNARDRMRAASRPWGKRCGVSGARGSRPPPNPARRQRATASRLIHRLPRSSAVGGVEDG